MKRLLIGVALILGAGAQAAGLPFAGADAKVGKTLVQKADCNGCHASIVGGDGTKIYSRQDRKVKSASQLLTQVRYCNSQLGTNWFPEDEANAAAYLNSTYYHFK